MEAVETVNNEFSARDKNNAKSAIDLAEEAMDQFVKFVSLLQSGERGFVSRLVPMREQDYGGEYDHLARVAEWATAEAQEEDGDE